MSDFLESLSVDGFGHYLAGFVDGEGCFIIHRKCSPGFRPYHQCWFRIKLREDDSSILRTIKQRTGLGVVRFRKNGKSKPQAEWKVVRKQDCQALVKIFDRFKLRAKKSRDFEIWRKAVILHAEVKKLKRGTGNGRGSAPHHNQLALCVLYEQLKHIRKYEVH